MWKDVERYVKGCEVCQCTKPNQKKCTATLHLHDTAEELWQTVSVDLIGEIPKWKRFDTICIFIDWFSKQTHLVSTYTELTSEGMACLYRDHVFYLHGIPQKVIHDWGTQFTFSFIKDLYHLLKITENPSTAYHL